MKEIKSRIAKRESDNVIHVTWEIRNGLLARLFGGLPKISTFEAGYVGGSTVWRSLPSYRRVSTRLEARLSDIEARLLATTRGDESCQP